MTTMSPTSAERMTLDRVADIPMLGLVQQWAAINSGSSNVIGLATMADALADSFSRLPGEIVLLDPAPADRMLADGRREPMALGRNLSLTVRPDAGVQVILTGHMDTVFAADHPFQTLQWLDNVTLNGPGVADMKGGIAVMLAALTALEQTPVAQKLGYRLIINSDEEIGSPGSSALIAQAARGKVAALTYEPSMLPDGTLAGSRPGSGNFSIHITGRSAHAGRNPEDGRNAVLAAADLALRLAAARHPGLSVNPARIDGGSPNNVVPDHAVLRVNLRPRTPDDEVTAKAMIDRLIAEIAATHDVSVHLHGGFARPPKPMNPATERLFELVRDCGALLGQEIGWKPSGGVCDGNNIAACGVPVVDTMGVRGGAIHSADEYLLVDSLIERAQLSTLVLMRIAQGGWQ